MPINHRGSYLGAGWLPPGAKDEDGMEAKAGDERDMPRLDFGLGKRLTAFASKSRHVGTETPPSSTAADSNDEFLASAASSLPRGGNGEGCC